MCGLTFCGELKKPSCKCAKVNNIIKNNITLLKWISGSGLYVYKLSYRGNIYKKCTLLHSLGSRLYLTLMYSSRKRFLNVLYILRLNATQLFRCNVCSFHHLSRHLSFVHRIQYYAYNHTTTDTARMHIVQCLTPGMQQVPT